MKLLRALPGDADYVAWTQGKLAFFGTIKEMVHAHYVQRSRDQAANDNAANDDNAHERAARPWVRPEVENTCPLVLEDGLLLGRPHSLCFPNTTTCQVCILVPR